MAESDPISPIAPARIRALLLPVGKISESAFHSFANQMRSQSIIRLGDVSPDTRPDRIMFSPLAFPSGKVMYDFSSCLPPASLLRSSTIELFRDIMVIIGIANGMMYHSSSLEPNEDIYDLQEAMGRAREHFPKALSLNLVLFNVTDPAPFKHLPAGTVTVPPLDNVQPTFIKTVVCDITSRLLGEMAIYAKNIMDLQSLETLSVSSTGYGSNPHKPWLSDPVLERSSTSIPLEEQSRPMTPLAHDTTASSGSSTTPSQSTPPVSSLAAPGGLWHDSLEIDTIPNRAETTQAMQLNGVPGEETSWKRTSQVPSTDNSREKSRDRKSLLGHGLNTIGDRARHQLKSRQGIVIGTLYLHAGRWHDALRELVESTTRARANSDHLWHAKGLENILITMLLLLWSESEFQIPPICYPSSEKSFSSIMHMSSRSEDTTRKLISQDDMKNILLKSVSILIPDVLNMIMNIHVRAYSTKGETLPQFAFSDFTIRSAYLMSLLCADGSQLSRNTLEHIVTGTSFKSDNEKIPPVRSPRLLKQEVGSFLFRAMPSLKPGSEVSVSDTLIIYCGIARVLSLLSLPRKRAFIIRKILLDLIPGLIQARKIGAAEAGIHPAAGLTAWNMLSTAGGSQSLAPWEQDTGQYLHDLLEVVCRTYGVHINASISTKDEESTSNIDPAQLNGLNSPQHAHSFHGKLLREIVDESAYQDFGSVTLKKDVLQLSVNVCEALPDFSGVLRYASTYLRAIRLPNILNGSLDNWVVNATKDDQQRIAAKILQTVSATHNINLATIECRYWDDFLVRGIRVSDSELSLLLTSHNPTEINFVNDDHPVTQAIEHGPFIYDPFTKSKPKSIDESVIVCGDQSVFVITFQNIYNFELVIEDVQILSEGVDIACPQQSFTVGPCTQHHQTVTGSALEPGTMHLVGCNVKIRGCTSRRFLLFDKPWHGEANVKVKSCRLMASLRPASHYTLTLPETFVEDSLLSKSVPIPTASRTSILVIQPQPILAITNTSIAQSTFMILEGETKSLFVTVQNLSESVMVDFINISVKDSTSSLVPSRTNPNFNSADIHEFEYQEIHHRAIKWRRGTYDKTFCIMPGASETFEMDVFGKAGLTDASVRIDYAHLGMPAQSIKANFYARHVTLPIIVTVNASVQLQKVEILPAAADSALAKIFQQNQNSYRPMDMNAQTPSNLKPHQSSTSSVMPVFTTDVFGIEPTQYYTLILELRNVWPHTLSLSLDVFGQSEDHASAGDSRVNASTVHQEVGIHPGHTARVALLLPRVQPEFSYRQTPNKNSTGRKQFLIANTPQLETDQPEREAVWFRQELIRKLTAYWYDRTSERQGSVELGGLRLSPRMIEIMREEPISISMKLHAIDEMPTPFKETGCFTYEVTTNTCLFLSICLHNRSRRLIRPLLRLQPRLSNQPYHVALDLTRRFAWTGLLQQIGPPLAPGDAIDFRLDICLLCPGKYEIGAVVHDVQTAETCDTARFSPAVMNCDEVPLPDSSDTLVGRSLCRLIAEDR